jgi:hypothetical protein
MIGLRMPIFSLVESDFIAILALCIAGGSSLFTAFAFLKTYGRNRKSEQFKIARDIRDKINSGINTRRNFATYKFREKGSVEDKRNWIVELVFVLDENKAQVGYFTELVKQKEIRDKGVMKYYKKNILSELEHLDDCYAFVEENMRSDTKLAAAVEDSFSEDVASGLARIRGELLQHKKVWEQK